MKQLLNKEGFNRDCKTIKNFLDLFPKNKKLTKSQKAMISDAMDIATKRNMN